MLPSFLVLDSRTLRALAALVSVLVWSPLSLGQTPKSPTASFDGVTERARARLEQGLEAYQRGHFRAAVEHFKEADRLAPSARLSFNIALAYERMTDGPNALAAYRDYLRRMPEAQNAAATSVRIAELELGLQRSGVQQVSVLSTPAGATVEIDDVSRGMTPWTGELPPGSHRIALRAAGFKQLQSSFELPPRHAIDVLYDLEPLPTATPALASRPSAAPRDDRDRVVSWWTWTAFGTSAALLLGSGAIEFSRRALEQDAQQADLSQFEAQDKYGPMNSRTVMARVLLGAGGVAAAVGGFSLYLDLARRQPSSSLALGLSCSPEECAAIAKGYW